MVHIAFLDSYKIGAAIIRLATWSEVSHVAFVDMRKGTVIDSRLGNNGVSERPMSTLAGEYHYIDIRAYPAIPYDAIEFARSQIGKPYDMAAILGMGMHRDWQDDSKWFCSELVAWACGKAGHQLIRKETWRVTPQDLYQAV